MPKSSERYDEEDINIDHAPMVFGLTSHKTYRTTCLQQQIKNPKPQANNKIKL